MRERHDSDDEAERSPYPRCSSLKLVPRIPFFLLPLAALGLVPATARGETVPERCVARAAEGQKSRDEGHLLESRALFVQCGAEACPSIVARECVRWLAEVDERMPTLVIAAKGSNGRDVLADITLDGKPLAAASVGRDVQLDPGRHTIAASASGYESKTETVVVREREKGRRVELVLVAHSAVDTSAPAPATGRSIPALSGILGAVAVAGGAGFGYFWWRGMDEVRTLRESCAPHCTSEQIDEAREPLTIARVSLGIGIAAAVGAVVVYLVQPRSTPATTTRSAVTTHPSGFVLRF